MMSRTENRYKTVRFGVVVMCVEEWWVEQLKLCGVIVCE
jgi:hypothetical protein